MAWARLRTRSGSWRLRPVRGFTPKIWPHGFWVAPGLFLGRQPHPVSGEPREVSVMLYSRSAVPSQRDKVTRGPVAGNDTDHRREGSYNVVADELDQIFQDREDVLPLGGAGIAKAYLDGDLCVWVRFKLGGGVSQAETWLAVFQRLRPDFGDTAKGISAYVRVVDVVDPGLGRSHRGGDDKLVAVLVDDVQAVEPVEASTDVRAVVRLHRVERVSDVIPDGQGQSWSFDPSARIDGGLFVLDRECDVARLLPTGANELTGEVVQHAPQVVDAVPEHDDNRVGDSGRVAGVVRVVETIGVDLHLEGVNVAFGECGKLIPEDIEVSLCSPHFEASGVETGRLRPLHTTATICLKRHASFPTPASRAPASAAVWLVRSA